MAKIEVTVDTASLARAVILHHGRPSGLFDELTPEEVIAFAEVPPGDFAAFDAAFSRYRQRLADQKTTTQHSDLDDDQEQEME